MSDKDLFSRITGKRPVIVVEGDTDRIFLDCLWKVIPGCQEPDFLQLGGVENLNSRLGLLIKNTELFNSIPSIKIIVDCDKNESRLTNLSSLLNSEGLEEGGVYSVERSLFKPVLENMIKVGAFLLRGTNPDSPDLEGLISDSQEEVTKICRQCLVNDIENPHGYSKRLRFAERACNNTDLGDVSYHSLYGSSSGINFESPSFQALKDFIALE